MNFTPSCPGDAPIREAGASAFGVSSGDDAMIRLSILRHGKAEPDSDSGLDEDRPLREKGERQARFMAEFYASHSEHAPGVILHSGLGRARQTAGPIAEALGVTLRQSAGLCPEDPPSSVLDLVALAARAKPGPRSIMIVGHNPQLGSVIGILTSGICGEDALLRTGECFILDVNLNQPIGSARLIERVRMPSDKADVGPTGLSAGANDVGRAMGSSPAVRR